MNVPNVYCQQLNPGLPVAGVPAAVDFYINKLGFKKGSFWGDPPGFASVILGEVQVHLLKAIPAPGVCHVYFAVDDADVLFDFQFARG